MSCSRSCSAGRCSCIRSRSYWRWPAVWWSPASSARCSRYRSSPCSPPRCARCSPRTSRARRTSTRWTHSRPEPAPRSPRNVAGCSGWSTPSAAGSRPSAERPDPGSDRVVERADRGQIQLQAGAGHVLLQVRHRRGARDRQHDRRALQHPGQCHLGRRGVQPLGGLVHHPARLGQLAGGQRVPRDEADAPLGAVAQHLVGGPVGQVVAVLHGGHVHDDRRVGDLVDGHLGEPDQAHLALGLQLGEHAVLVICRHRRVNPVQLEQVDALHPEAAQAHLALLAQVLRASTLEPLARAGTQEAGLGGNHQVFVVRVQRLPDQLLADVRAVRVGGVDQVHPELDGAAQHPDRLVVVGRRTPDTRSGQLHRTKAQPGHRDRVAEPDLSTLGRRSVSANTGSGGTAHVVSLRKVAGRKGPSVTGGTRTARPDVMRPTRALPHWWDVRHIRNNHACLLLTHPAGRLPIVTLRIGNASGFYGDRFSAVREMLTGGPLDVLTGDYLAELTMLILGRDRLKDAGRGYARAFLRQLEENLGLAVERGVKIVTNAGGLNPAGLAEALRGLSHRLGISASIAYVTGDDLLDRAGELNLGEPLTANAYLGGWGIAECLRAGADVVVTGRVTDASLVVGPAAAHYGWARDDYDRLAGATVAGHVIECGAQATGGNYAFFTELPDATHVGFPIAEIDADGSTVITKHPGTGGAVTVETVTAQLLYEIAGPRYLGPDVTSRFDTISLAPDDTDRVRISGVLGESPPDTLKVCLNTLAGFRNSATFVLCGLDIEAKAALARRQLAAEIGADGITWTLARTDHADADTEETASALLHATIRTPDAKRARGFSRACVELALASYPGFTLTAPPADGTPVGVYRPEYVPADQVAHVAVLPSGSRVSIPPHSSDITHQLDFAAPAPLSGPTRRVPLGTVLG